MKIALFFGSFNPLHNGHLMIANYVVEYTSIDQLWFVVSPHNPLKEKSGLLAVNHRIAMLRRAIEYDNRFKICDIETRLPQPSYTIDTLTYLQEENPANEFVLLMGSDGLPTFHKWKNYEVLQEKYWRYIYPRPGDEALRLNKYTNVEWIDAPMIEISASFIRNAVALKKDIRYYMPPEAYAYMRDMNFYK